MTDKTDHIQNELAHIGERLAAGPDPFEHASLYMAQQTLVWAQRPGDFASPMAIIVGKGARAE